MKTKFSFLFLLFAFVAITASAQTASSPAQKTEKPAYWIPDNVLPAAEHYEGGKEAMYEFIGKEVKYPALAKRNRVQGDCIIGFTINEDGSTSGFKVLRNAGAGTGEEAMRVAKLLKFKAPGYALNVSIPIKFKL
ncbi:TonB family protein [Pontibacter sp. KCTC 32443]|uniref:energy transducer TonB n=1 Tax=Pontibacter TaxID=323449 RepID=UPI00164DD4B3|nr:MULTISPECIES: energy transducer TonB [Pontibacter]MBC5775286.1 TonB family protein [Pontibacter sp. KCTC 32443]